MHVPLAISNWRLWLLFAAFLAAGILFFSLDLRSHFASDVSALLPPAEEKDEAAAILSQVREQKARLIVGALLPPEQGWEDRRDETAAAFLESLRSSNLFRALSKGAGPSDPDALARAVYEGRLDLLLPSWAEEAGLAREGLDAQLWAEAIVASLEEFLTRPEAAALADLLPADPFPLAAWMGERSPDLLQEAEEGPVLFWAVQDASPFEPEGQAPVFDALDDASREAGEALPGTQVQSTSVARFAAESEQRIRREITVLNFAAILLVGLVAVLCFRRRAVLLHLLVIAIFSVAGGLAATVFLFPVVHILSLVVGGLLVGVAVDYGIHILLHQSAVRGEGFLETLREVRKPLLASALSTAAGFAALTFADLSLLRQIGVFVGGGLVTALVTSWLYLPLWRRPEQLSPVGSPRRLRGAQRWILVPAAVLFLLPLAGWLRLEWHDDLRELQPPMPELSKNDAEVRRMFATGETFSSWICHGETPGEAREALASFESRWAQAGGDKDHLLSLSSWIAAPGPRQAIRSLFRNMPNFEAVLKKELEASGFDAEEFNPFFDELRTWLSPDAPSYAERLENVARTMDGPAGMLLHRSEKSWWFLVSVSEHRVPAGWQTPDGTISAAQIETLNTLFSTYRESAWRISGISFLIIAGGVLLAYGLLAGGTALLLPCLAWAWGMGLLGFTASPLSLFHVLGGFLGFCVALDYGLFFRHAREANRALPRSIRVSAATTLSAFGVLSFASIPAVAALGASVFLIVFAALFILELSALYGSATIKPLPAKDRGFPGTQKSKQ